MRILPLVLLLLAGDLWAAPPFRVALAVAAGNTDWRTLDEVTGRPVFLAVADGLVGFDPVTGFIKPGLADSWVVEAGGKSWTFTLKTARWSDGTPLTSQDFLEAWKKASVPAIRFEAPDPRHFKVLFQEPLADVSVLTAPPYLLFPDPAAPNRSAGPFLIDTQEPGRSLVLTKNPVFREAKTIRLERLEFQFVPTLEEAGALFRDGLVDWVPRGGGPGTLAEPGLKNAVVSQGWGSVFLRLNLGAARLGDPAYRRSLSEALDRASLVKGLRGPLVFPSSSLVPQTGAVPAKAVSGKRWGPLPEPKLTILHPVGETYRSLAQGIADQWNRRLGIDVETKAEPFNQVREDRASGNYEVVVSAWLGDFPDPSAFLNLFRSGGPDNDMGFTEPAFDTLLDQLRTLAPGKVRTGALLKAGNLLEAVWPVIPLVSYASVNQIDLRRWTGWSANPTDIHPWQGIGPRK